MEVDARLRPGPVRAGQALAQHQAQVKAETPTRAQEDLQREFLIYRTTCDYFICLLCVIISAYGCVGVSIFILLLKSFKVHKTGLCQAFGLPIKTPFASGDSEFFTE